MNVSRMIEVRLFDSSGQEVGRYDIDVSSSLMSKKWPKVVYKVLRDCIQTCIQGGIVSMRGVLTLQH